VTYDEVGFVRYLPLAGGIVFRLGAFRGVRGKCTTRHHAGTNLVLRDPNVPKFFRIERAVNYAVRLVIELGEVGSYKPGMTS
jgi:hypothetical protein